jgi:hypothetical protein
MQAASHSPTRAEAAAFAAEVAGLWDCELGSQLAGFYLIGSLAHGGFSPRYSDIDVALVAEKPLTQSQIEFVRQMIGAHSQALASRVSLFWTDRHFSVGRFPPLDRIDFLDHAVPLIERRRLSPERPTLSEVRGYLAGEPLRKWSEETRRWSEADELPPPERKRYLRALLYPARYVYSWQTGRIASNDEAVAYLKGHAPGASGVVERALQCRNSGQDPDALFPERRRLLDLRALCQELVQA